MFMLKKKAFAFLFVLATCVISCAQQDGSKRPSPAAQAQCKFSGGKTITVNYSSPRMKGRKVFGELVPYGEVWRTGANEATTFVTTEDLITAKGTVIINKHTSEWGIPYKYESEELARVPISATRLSSPIENFTISFDSTGGSCTMRVSWENTQASIEFAQKNADVPTVQ
jgi:Protein of unknown function (DUF2911)